MAYHVYTTTGIVLSSSPLKEVDRYYKIFTKDLGTVFAVGKGVRKNESKMRGSLDDFSVMEVSFIKGRREWRIVNVRLVENIFRVFRGESGKRTAALRLFSMVQTLVVGEDPNPELFHSTISAIDFLKKTKLSIQEILAWELIAKLRTLSVLGYTPAEHKYEPFLATSVWSLFLIQDAVPILSDIRKDVEEALSASDLYKGA